MYSPRGLKTTLIIDLATLLAIAMLLVNFVMVGVAHKDLLSAEKLRAGLFLNSVGHLLTRKFSPVDGLTSSDTRALYALLDKSGFICLYIRDDQQQLIFKGGMTCGEEPEIDSLLAEAAADRQEYNRFQGTTWGVFWSQHKELITAAPIAWDAESGWTAAVVLPLDSIYQQLRNSQNVFYAYFFANLIFLTLFGFYRLHKIFLLPIMSLVARAEEFSDNEGFYFSSEKSGGEFSRLSKGLNMMLKRINRDKMKLQSSVSSLERANLELKKAQNDMIRAEKLASVGRLAAGIAHEIGNPIGIVLGYFDLLKQKGLSEAEQTDFLNRAENEVNRINLIIRQLLDFSRPAEESAAKVFSVNALLEDIKKILGVQPLLTGIDLELDLQAAEDRFAGDANHLRQVFVNLLINGADAIKASARAEQGRIVIDTMNVEDELAAKRTQGLKITISDNGEGIAENDIANIFDPFFTTKEPGKGTGLGLSICFSIIDGLGGKISVASRKGEGTAISILLPLIDEQEDIG